jgi:two-component system cell cycle sensor histidine kinase/response regulator CckA
MDRDDPDPGMVMKPHSASSERRRARHAPAPSPSKRTVAQAYADEAAALRQLIEENADGIVVVGDDGRVRYANAAAAELFGRPARVLVGELFGFPIGNDESLMLDIVRPGGEDVVAEMRVVHSSWHGETADIVSLRDVTAQRQLELQLRHAQKMDALGRLAGGISHDFNNMLTSILCEASVLADAFEQDDERLRAARQIQKTATRAAELTSQLLTFSRGRMATPKLVDMVPVVRDMERMLRRIIGDRVELRTRYEVPVAGVLLERGPLEQVLLNLSVNARDAMPEGGALEISVGRQRIPARGAGRHSGGDFIQLMVKDDGCGMATDVVARIFEPFFTTKPDGHGSGLGLSVVYGIVDQAGGRISVHSEPGAGTTFQVLLPHAEGGHKASASQRAAEDTVEVPPAKPGVVLLAEDEPAVREIVAEILAADGHEVLAARDGYEAEQIVAASDQPVDLVVTDVSMPRRTGPELVALLRKQGLDAPVVFLSGYPKDEGLDERFDWTRTVFVAKPFTHHRLITAVRSQLAVAREGVSGK